MGLAIELSGLWSKLRALRLARAGLTQEALAGPLGVVGRTMSDWETGRDYPTLAHLLIWCKRLDARLVLIGPGGQVLRPRVERRAGEKWARRETRRLVDALRAERLASRHSQLWLARRLGMTRVSVNRLENAAIVPRVPVLAQWAAALGCTIVLEPLFSAP